MTRQNQVLDAAIAVLGTGGMRQLTHRAVDAEAELPQGSTSNLFRTRDALLIAVLGRILERETHIWTRAMTDLSTVDGFASVVGTVVHELVGDGRDLTLARNALFNEAAVRPALRARIGEGQRQLARMAGPALRSLGSIDPVADLRLLLALVHGLMANQLANPQPHFDPAGAVRTLLSGLAFD